MRQKTEYFIVFGLCGALVLLAALAFFKTPAYERAVMTITESLTGSLATILGYLFGRTMPQQAGEAKAGQTSITESTTVVAPSVPPKEG